MQITVVTRNLSNPDEPPSVRFMDYSQRSARTWLAKHSFWAFHNNHSVTTFKEEKDG